MIDDIDTSIIFDITQRVNAPEGPSDMDAVDFHFKDIAVDQGRTAKIWGKRAVLLLNLSVTTSSSSPLTQNILTKTNSPDKPAYEVIGTVSARPNDPPTLPPTFIAILMTIIRLEQQKTDIVVTINVPFDDPEVVRREKCIASPVYTGSDIDSENGDRSELLKFGMQVASEVVGNFKILDWGLFVPEE